MEKNSLIIFFLKKSKWDYIKYQERLISHKVCRENLSTKLQSLVTKANGEHNKRNKCEES